MDLRKLEDEGPRLSDKPQKIPDELPDGVPVEKHLWLMVELESWPNAYDMFFWAIILILFCNIFLFLFVSSRAGRTARQLFYAVLRLCVGEGLVLLIFYLLGRFAMGA